MILCVSTQFPLYLYIPYYLKLIESKEPSQVKLKSKSKKKNAEPYDGE